MWRTLLFRATPLCDLGELGPDGTGVGVIVYCRGSLVGARLSVVSWETTLVPGLNLKAPQAFCVLTGSG
eukprot:2111695-Prymnesium_polylepis.3